MKNFVGTEKHIEHIVTIAPNLLGQKYMRPSLLPSMWLINISKKNMIF